MRKRRTPLILFIAAVLIVSSLATATTAFAATKKYPGKKYAMTDKQAKVITSLIVNNVGSPNRNLRIEASLLANRYQLYGKKYKTIYDFATKSNWYEKGAVTYAKKHPSKNSKKVKIVKHIISKGNRILPHYVDEMDTAVDIRALTLNGKYTNKLVSGKTIVRNYGGGTYTYYTRTGSGSGSSLYGYTAYAKKHAK